MQTAAMYKDLAGGQRLMPKKRRADVGSPSTCTAIPSTKGGKGGIQENLSPAAGKRLLSPLQAHCSTAHSHD